MKALPKPATSIALPGPTSPSSHSAFSEIVSDPDILRVCRDLFASGHYNVAVQEAFKCVDNLVEARVPGKGTGVKLMRTAFSVNDPKLTWSNRNTDSEKDQHEGYQHLFAGAMLGIRNPVTHHIDWIDSPDEALEAIVLAQHLLVKAKLARTADAESS